MNTAITALGKIKKLYIPILVVKESNKGIIYQAVSLKNLSFKTCLIKQGIPGALADANKRDMKDRLIWQQKVIRELDSSIPTPAYIDYFEDKEHSYLVLKYVEGVLLYTAVIQIYAGRTWEQLPITVQLHLLGLYLQILEIVKTIHQRGFVHRDITDSNFILLKNGKLCIIDFELSYSVRSAEPEPPFVLGTYGYMSPEQIKNSTPDYPQDIYSLGSLLCFILTTTPPKDYLAQKHQKNNRKLQKITTNTAVNQIIINCLSPEPNRRPTITQMQKIVNNYISELKAKDQQGHILITD